MKISDVIVATDLNPLYSNFIPIFIKSWNKLFPEVRVHIILIANEIPDKFKNYKEIILFKPIKGIKNSYISQFIRILYPALIKSNNGVIITDMDMIPMNRYYYEEAIKNIDNNKFISYRDCILKYNQIPICYNVATPKVWGEIFNINNEIDIINRIKEEYNKINYDGKHGGKGWSTDQLVLKNIIYNWNNKTKRFILLNDKITKYNRLDRSHNITINKELGNWIKNKCFSDYHMKRPYNDYKKLNDWIVECL